MFTKLKSFENINLKTNINKNGSMAKYVHVYIVCTYVTDFKSSPFSSR